MNRVPAAIAASLLLAACSSGAQTSTSSSPTAPSPTPTPIVGVAPTQPPGATVVAGASCGSSPIYSGHVPSWASVNAPAGLNYVIATPDLAMGYLFSYPLKAGPDGDKILWYVRAPRNGKTLIADGRPIGKTAPTAHFEQPANSGPGEIYPSGVTVPAAGCWRFHLSWNNHTADIDLLFS